MLVFIVPLKSAKLSHDWALTSRLFERCVRALCNQTSPNFRVVVVCNERPECDYQHANLHYCEVDFPPPVDEPEDAGGYELARSKNIARKNADKARKILTGLEFAARFAPTHTMVVDADDCVSNRLAQLVEQHPDSVGWYCKSGYFHNEGSRFLFLNRQNFNVVCGTSVIVSYAHRHLLFPTPDFYQHAFYDPPPGLVPLPFEGVVYLMATGDNIYMSAQTRNEIYGSLFRRVFSKRIFAIAWKLLNYRPHLLTEARRREFGLYTLGERHPTAPLPTGSSTGTPVPTPAA
ncbi:MAG TPA: glycosyltransferase family A protein [Gemmataceae bacterium]|nr:glycosyltransferase family A protein [Gemmataceae bacterium]